MPMRPDASYCRPRLYTEDDSEREDDVGLLMESLQNTIDMAMAEGDDETVAHATSLKKRITKSAEAARDG